MLDENDVKYFKIIKNLIIATIVIAIIVVLIIVFKDKVITNRIKNKLTQNGFKQSINNTYSKEINDDLSQTSYTYDFDSNTFSKYISNITREEKENIRLQEENGVINVYYTYKGSNCSLTQEGTYKNEKFTCDIVKKSRTCTAKCDVILSEIKEFQKDIKKIK